MSSQFSIVDMHLFNVERSEDRWFLLRDSDHLLRRFGQLDLVSLVAGGSKELSPRAEADEIWFVLNGKVSASLVDEREGSPSQGEAAKLSLNANEPQGLLIPFGVAHSFSSIDGASLLCLSTHSDVQHEMGRRAIGRTP